MKQLLIVNSGKSLKSGVADDLTVLDAGQIGFFNLTPDTSGGNAGKITFLSAKPTKNFGIALGRGANLPAFVIPEVDVNTLSVTIADPVAGKKFQAKFTFPTPEAGKEYGVVAIKKGVVPNERNKWTTTIVAKTTNATTEAGKLADAINAKTNDVCPIVASNTGAVVTIECPNIGEQWAVQLIQGLYGTAFTTDYPVEAEPNIGDAAYIKDLAQRCAADKGFVYLDQASKDIYPGYPEAVEEIAQADIATKGYVLFSLRFATKRDSGKTGDEQVLQYVHIAVPKNNASISTIKSILEQPVLPNTAAEVQNMIDETLTNGNYLQQGEGDNAFKTKGENDLLYEPKQP